jgi:hypothetical protein
VEVAFITAVALSVLLSLYYLAYFRPVEFIRFQAEDSWAEYATFVSWTLAALLFVRAALREGGWWRRPGLWLFAGGALFVGMEEISWGQRLFGLRAPELFEAQNLQGELTFHNLFREVDYYPLIGTCIGLYAIALPLVARWRPSVRSWCDRLGIPIVPLRLWPLFAVAIFLFDLSEQVLRLPSNLELGELALGMAMAVFAFDRGRDGRDEVPGGWTGVIPGLCAVLGVVWLSSAPLVYVFGQPGAVKNDLNKFARIFYPQKLPSRAALIFDYLDEHPELRTVETAMHQGVFYLANGRAEEGRGLLSAVLDEVRLDDEGPSGRERSRLAVYALIALDRRTEARELLSRLLQASRERVAAAEVPLERAWALAELGVTQLLMGSRKDARQTFAAIRDLSLERHQRLDVDRWIGANRRWHHRFLRTMSALAP